MKLLARQTPSAETSHASEPEALSHWQDFQSPTAFGDLRLKPFRKVLAKVAEREVGKEDIVVPFADLKFVDDTSAIDIHNYGRVLVHKLAFTQLCTRLKIPADYMERCPLQLRNSNLSYWTEQNDERKVLLRIRRFPPEQQKKGEPMGVLRAVLPQTYEPIDNVRILDWVATALRESDGKMGIQSARVREVSTHLRLVFHKSYELQESDPFYFGVHVSDSEVGERGFFADFVVYRPNHDMGFLPPIDGGHLVSQRHIHIDFKLLRRSFSECFDVAKENIETVRDMLTSAQSAPVTDPRTYIRRLVRHHRLTNDFAETVIVAYDAEPIPTRFGIALAVSRAARRMDVDMRVDTEALVGSYLLEGA